MLIKSGDAGRHWSQFSPQLVSALQARGLKVCAWQFVYGDQPKAEARVGAASVARGADCLVIDAEGHYEGEYAEASTYMAALRARIGADYPLGLSSFPYVDYHPAFPYSVFLGPGAAQYNMPQLYWKTIGDRVDDAFVHTYVFNRAYGRADPADRADLPEPEVEPGAALPPPRGRPRDGGGQLVVVAALARSASGRRSSAPVAPIAGYQTYDSYPVPEARVEGRPRRLGPAAARRRRLRDAGHRLLRGADAHGRGGSAGCARAWPRPGSIDVPTWNVLLTHTPLKVRWTKSGAVAASRLRRAARAALGEAARRRRYEIPPLGGADRP